MAGSGYVGRFAPSPTGRLHLGSLLAAVASWCDARHHGGQWLVRMEDLDPPREVPGAADDILRTLEAFGLQWDGPVRYQSERGAAYQEALATLEKQGWAYPCGCSRRMLEGQARYPGTCRQGVAKGLTARSYRFRLDSGALKWKDGVQGEVSFSGEDLGDFILRRADGYWAYQLAVVVDDLDQGVNVIVRGADLLDSTPRQMALRHALAPDSAVDHWAHVPILVNAAGQKLSKQTLALPVEAKDADALLLRVIHWLGQCATDREWSDARDSLGEGGPKGLLDWAARGWDMQRIPPGPLQGQDDGHA